MGQERRRSQRLALDLEGILVFLNEGRETGGRVLVKDISRHGVCLGSDFGPPRGCRVQIFLKWPRRGLTPERLLVLYGKVVRLENFGDEGYRFAVDFESPLMERMLQEEKGVRTIDHSAYSRHVTAADWEAIDTMMRDFIERVRPKESTRGQEIEKKEEEEEGS